MANLLSRTELTQAHALAEFYVIYDNKDYRMTFETLLSLVTVASLKLDQVENTKDLKKPISEQVQEALAQKANTLETATKEQYTALVASLKDYVKLDAMNLAIKGITDSLNNYVTDAELTTAVNEALSPMTQSMAQLALAVKDQADQVALVVEKTANMVITSTMTQAITTAKNEMTQLISDQSTSFSQTIQQLDQTITRLSQAVTAMSQALDGKANSDHTHLPANITGLEDYVKALIPALPDNVVVGAELEW